MPKISYCGSDGCSLHATVVGDGDGLPLILMHAGGPDHESLLPLAARLADRRPVVLPDLRGYGRSVCADSGRHTWAQYTDDVVRLLDLLGLPGVALGGAGLGSTITLRVAAAHPGRACRGLDRGRGHRGRRGEGSRDSLLGCLRRSRRG